MTEAEWLAGTDPQKLLEYLQDRASERKLRLFAVACCRQFDGLPDEETELAVNLAESFSDGLVSKEAVVTAQDSLYQLYRTVGPDQRYLVSYHACETRSPINAVGVAEGVIRGQAAARYFADTVKEEWHVIFSSVQKEQGLALTTILREIFGNLFRPASLHSAWLAWHDATLPKLAQAIYDERDLPSGHLDTTRMAILADALEDAGCTDETILSHCCGAGPHVRGCWVVDLLLGKG